MKIAVVQNETGLTTSSPRWQHLIDEVHKHQPDLLIMNEMPFGEWLPAAPTFDKKAAEDWVAMHETALAALCDLPVKTVLSSRPVCAGSRLANEAFLLDTSEAWEGDGHLEASPRYRFLHQKHYFPEEEGFFEATWFTTEKTGFNIAPIGDIKVGGLLCTELMFNEWARHYRTLGAHLIAAPRAAGTSLTAWHTAAKMAAITSGCYVVSANRAGAGQNGQIFGGTAFAYAPGGELIGETNDQTPTLSFNLNTTRVQTTQANYPCYVKELTRLTET